MIGKRRRHLDPPPKKYDWKMQGSSGSKKEIRFENAGVIWIQKSDMIGKRRVHHPDLKSSLQMTMKIIKLLSLKA